MVVRSGPEILKYFKNCFEYFYTSILAPLKYKEIIFKRDKEKGLQIFDKKIHR